MAESESKPAIPIPPWSEDKLNLLAKYLRAYSVIMAKQRQTRGWPTKYSYVDAFAGVGEWMDAEAKAYIDGSPKVALSCDPPFDSFAFIEKAPGRLSHLKELVKHDHPDRQAAFLLGDANQVIRDQVIRIVTKASRRHAVVFLDPYGLEVDFQTVAALGDAGTFDVFVNFSVMGVTRLLTRDQLPAPEHRDILNRVMGDSTWLDRFYESRENLFGETVTSRPKLDPLRLADHYTGRLKRHFRFISEPLLMRNSRSAPLYVLFLASQNQTGTKIVTQTFKRFERLKTVLG